MFLTKLGEKLLTHMAISLVQWIKLSGPFIKKMYSLIYLLRQLEKSSRIFSDFSKADGYIIEETVNSCAFIGKKRFENYDSLGWSTVRDFMLTLQTEKV